MQSQRWLLDAAIRTLGVDWDQGRTRYLAQACPTEAQADFGRVRDRVRTFAAIDREFAAAARRREAMADQAHREGRPVSERENAFTASILWGAAQWPLFEPSDLLAAYGVHKVACYDRFIAHAPHPVRRLEIPFQDGTIPALLHLPATGVAPFPCVIEVGGLDSFKEHLVAIYGDRYLERGIARLTFDGPGQGESLTRGRWLDATNLVEAGQAIMAWLQAEPAVDPARIGLSGTSLGSFWATRLAAVQPGLAGCAAVMVIHEPGLVTLLESASPTFRARFQFISGGLDDDAFASFAGELRLDDAAPMIRCPVLVVAGEDDDLSPIEHTWRLLDAVTAPRRLLLYQGERHGVASGPAAMLGPGRDEFVAEWFADRFAGREPEEGLSFVDMAGRVHERPLGRLPVEDALQGTGPRPRPAAGAEA
jgi:dienelactone hydrolase